MEGGGTIKLVPANQSAGNAPLQSKLTTAATDDEGAEEGLAKQRKTGARLYRICDKAGHYVKICLEAKAVSSL